MKKLILFLLLPVILLAATPYHRTFLLMGTFVEITLINQNDKVINETVKKIRILENKLSIFKKGSEIKKINALKKDKLQKVSRDVYEVIERSVYFSKLTDGAFDITVSPLLKLWKLEGGKLREIPSEKEINKALESVGWENIIFTPIKPAHSLQRQAGGEIGFKQDGISINLGGIAKGYIVDKAISYLNAKGIKSALINAGGDVYCLGEKENGESWNVGIRHPRKKKGVIGILKLKNKAVATSGDYEQFFALKGKKFCHIINPQTGYPVDSAIIQVTVVAETCIDADALATALMVMGKEKGIELIEKLANTEVVIIEEKEEKLDISYTKGLEKIIKINDE